MDFHGLIKSLTWASEIPSPVVPGFFLYKPGIYFIIAYNQNTSDKKKQLIPKNIEAVKRFTVVSTVNLLFTGWFYLDSEIKDFHC